jgi:hypothetical protein
MKHIKIFEEFSSDSINEGFDLVPVYDDMEFSKSGGLPQEKIKVENMLAYVQDLLDSKEQGEFESVSVVANIPMQGKYLPGWAEEYKTKTKTHRLDRKKWEEGSELELAPSDIEREPLGDDFMLPSEYEIVRVEGDSLVGYPKGERDAKSYETLILPRMVEEIHYL